MKNYKYLLIAGLMFCMTQPSWAEPANLYDQSLEAYQKKDYKTANKLIDQFIAENPDNPYGHEAKAMILANMNYYVKALAQLKQVLELSPKNHRAAESYGAILQRAINYLTKSGKHDKAVELAIESVGAIPDYTATAKGRAAANYACGIAYFEHWCKTDNPSDYKNYIEHMNLVRELDPVSPTGEIMIGAGIYNDGDYKRALTHFQIAKTLRSSNPTAAMWNGLTYSALGTYDLALQELDVARKVFSSNPNIIASIADVLLAQGKYEEAKTEYMTARLLKPNSSNMHHALSNLYVLTGNTAEGVETFRNEITENPNFLGFYHLAMLLHQMGDYKNAMIACQQGKSLAQDPYERAKIDVEQALIAFDENPDQKEVLLDKDDAQVLSEQDDTAYWVYMSYVDPQGPQRELAARKALRDTSPNTRWLHAQAFKSLARSKVEANQPIWALEMINQAWQRTPQSSKGLSSLKRSFDTVKEDAVKSLEKSLVKAKSTNNAKDMATYQAQLQAIKSSSLGAPGSRLLPTMTPPEAASMIVPPETDPAMANLSNAYSEPIRWMHFVERKII